MSSSERLPGVDGLRAVAALWVVLFNMAAFSHAQFPQVPGLDLFLRSGSTGVSLFLVLSGFCLYLPFAGGRAARFKVGEFFRRRCRRPGNPTPASAAGSARRPRPSGSLARLDLCRIPPESSCNVPEEPASRRLCRPA